VTQETRDLFNSNYSSAKFFAAKALQNLDFDLIELTKPFRQQDEKFHTLLKNLREGTSLKPTLETFNRKVTIAETGRDGAVSLCPRNADADFVNQERLGRLNGKEIIYSAKTSGVFRSNPLPAPAELCLRVGAQVVMTCNAKYWVNGSVAKVTEIDEDRVEVLLSKQNRKVEVRPNVWNQYEYRWSETTKQIEREVVGTYTQMPINLAWAMTIHKSQGLTLDEVHVDLGRGSFDTGQTYVALSRSRKIESLSLARPLQERDILIDLEARAFYDECRQSR
jgi:hypothetical protein